VGNKGTSSKADWGVNSSLIRDRSGFKWIKSKINRYDHAKLDHVQVQTNSRKANHPVQAHGGRISGYDHAKLDHVQVQTNSRKANHPVQAHYIAPPYRSRTEGFRLQVTIRKQSLPGRLNIFLPPLYRKEGVWAPVADAADYAVLWDQDVLEAYAAIMAADEENIARRFSNEHTKTDARRAWIEKLTAMPKADAEPVEMLTIYGSIHLRSLDDAIVVGVAQSAFAWLRKTRQVGGRKSNHARDNFAWQHLLAYRKFASAERRRAAKRGGMPSAKPKRTYPGFPGQEK
jgi:hypothetical protein